VGKLSSIYSKGEFAPVASTGQYLDLEGKPDIAAIAPNRWTTTGVKTANYTATTAENVPCNSTGGPFNVTLPAVGSRVRVFDAVGVSGAGGFAANSVTVLPSAGTTVMGDISFELDLGGAAFEFELIGTDWRVSAGIVPIQEPHFGGDYSELTNAPSLGDLIAETSPLVLPNNSRINGVEHFYQTTKPTVRGDNSALVVGDRWWKTDTGEEWFWNGSYWLSSQKIFGTTPIGAFSLLNSAVSLLSAAPLRKSHYLSNIYVEFSRTTGTIDVSNGYLLTFYQARNDGEAAGGSIGSYVISTIEASVALPMNIVGWNFGVTPITGLRCVVTTIGTPGAVRLIFFPEYRYIAL
jgi:hypothetical protein